MKKLTLTIIIAISLITLVSAAITVGNIYTQNQLDNQDVMNTDLEDSFYKVDGKVIHNISDSETEEIFYVNILSIGKEYLINETDNETYWSGDYKVVEKQFKIYADIARWKNRKDEVGIAQAKGELKQWLLSKKGRLEEQEKRKIMELQTKTNNLDDFDLEDMVI